MVCIRSSLPQPVLWPPRVPPVLLRPRAPMDPNHIARSIRRRAKEIRLRGKEIGFWEWCVWGFLKNVTVHMLFGSQVVDVTQVFGPTRSPEPHRSIHRVAAVRAASGIGYRSAVAPGSSGHVPVINHYVVVCHPDPSSKWRRPRVQRRRPLLVRCEQPCGWVGCSGQPRWRGIAGST